MIIAKILHYPLWRNREDYEPNSPFITSDTAVKAACAQGRRLEVRGPIRNTFAGPHSVKCVEIFEGMHPVPDEAFRGPEAKMFECPHLFNKNQWLMVSS